MSLAEYLGGVQQVIAGTNVTVTGTPEFPVVNSIGGGGGGGVLTVTAGTAISVGGTPTNPVINNDGVLSVGATGFATVSGTTNNPVVNVPSIGVTSVTAGNLGITVGGTATAPTISNAGVISIGAGNSGITVGGSSSNPQISNAGVLALTPGTGVSITGTNANLTVANAGVLGVTGGANVSISGTAQNPQINVPSIGVTSVTAGTGITVGGTATVPIINNSGVLGVSAGTGILVGGSPNNPTITNNGIQTLQAGTGILLTNTPDVNNQTVTNSGVLSVGAGTGVSITGTAQNPIINTSLTNFRPSFTIFVAPNGSDATGTGSEQNPFQTIGGALNYRATLVDTVEVGIYICEGTYNENVVISTGRTFLYGPSAPAIGAPTNIVGTVTVNITSISTIGQTYTVGLSCLQITGNITASGSASGPFQFAIEQCNVAGNIVMTRTGASGSLANIERNTITCGGGDTIGINNSGFALYLTQNRITCNATSQPCIRIGNAPSFSVAGTIFCNFNTLIMNSSISATLGACIRHENTSGGIGQECCYNQFLYIATVADTGSQNKCVIQNSGTGTTSYNNVCFNTMIVPGATFTGGAGQPVVIQERAGLFTISQLGGNYALASAYRIDTNVTHTALNLVS